MSSSFFKLDGEYMQGVEEANNMIQTKRTCYKNTKQQKLDMKKFLPTGSTQYSLQYKPRVLRISRPVWESIN